MSRSLGPRLPRDLVTQLSQVDLAPRLGRAVPVITVDADGRPHAMLCSYLELRAVDAGAIRLAIGAASRSATNLVARGTATLLLIEPGRAVYVKCRWGGGGGTRGELRRFDLLVEDVTEDGPAPWEEGVRIVSGIGYSPVAPMEAAEVREVLELLREE